MAYWSQTLLPMFRDYLRDQYLCDLWFVCDGGALVPCHKLMINVLLGEIYSSLLEEFVYEDCYVTLEGWPPEKLALDLEHLYLPEAKVSELQKILKHTGPPYNPMTKSAVTARVIPSAGDEFIIPKKHRKIAKCPNCGKVFSLKYFKKYHVSNCGRESATLSCDICKKSSFVSKVTLANHVRSVHSNDKPFSCEYCDMKFARSETLSKHRFSKHRKNKKGETITKSFVCEICDKKLSSSTNLLHHLKVIHEGIRKFQCQFCDKQFSSRFNKTSHEGKVHIYNDPQVVVPKTDSPKPKDDVQYVTHLEPVKIIPS